MLYDVIDELPHKTLKSSEFKQLLQSVYENIVSLYNISSYAKNSTLNEIKKNIKYDIPTCVGSSGAKIVALELNGTEINFTTATHNTGNLRFNKSHLGLSSTL